MGIFGRSRANTTNLISQPTLTYSDAAPREDLQSILAVDSPRPRTAKPGRSTPNQNGKGHPQPHQHIAQQFDFTVTEPPGTPAGSELVRLNDARADANAIGIALGSPSMAPPPPQYHSIETNLSRPVSSEKVSEKEGTTRTDSLRRKPSKWKKFGTLLKASRQLEMKQTREGFYQLDIDRSQSATPSGSQRHLTATGNKQKENVKASPQRRANKGDIPHAGTSSALLKVDIPTVQMERYSVMFRSVLGEKPPSSLLARRSKALDQLHVQPPLPEAYKPQRRGTSPGPSRAPAVSHGETTNKTDNKTNNGFRSPVRANTFPRAAALSKFNNSHLAVPDLTPALSTGTSLDEDSSAESSPIPFDSPVITRNHIDGAKPSPVWEMVTKKPSSMPPQTNYKVISADASARSTPVTTPLVGTDASTSPKIKSLPLPPSRKESRPPRPDHAVKPKTVVVVSTKEIKQQPEQEQEQDDKEDDQVLLIQRPEDDHPPKLVRSQTMPLPLNINKTKPKTQTLKPKTSATSMTTPITDSEDSPLQTIEISIARSVSVARRAPKQTLVPLGASPEVFHNANERFGEHQKLLPTLVNVSKHGGGHHRPKSQDIVIETL